MRGNFTLSTLILIILNFPFKISMEQNIAQNQKLPS